MRPGARLAAAIEILDLIDDSRRPADLIVRDYFKSRRYAGSKDRRGVGESVFGALRQRAAHDWRLSQVGLEPDNRRRVLLAAEMPEAFSGPHDPEPPTVEEAAALESARALDMATAPDAARLNYPAWLENEIRDAMGGGDQWRDRAEAALSGRAATDLRVNTLKTDRDSALDQLRASDIGVEAFRLAPGALRLTEPKRLEDHSLYQDGGIEVQDAGSQYVGHLAGARSGMSVLDLCAGAGGKTLLLAADMADQGTLVASDIDGRRLERLSARAQRAGLSCIETRTVKSKAAWRESEVGMMDRILVDAPCSGTGTWRRQPEQRWRLTRDRLDELIGLQASILDRAAPLVREGGRLIYVTCSFLQAENEIVITDFLARDSRFATFEWTEAAREAGLSLPSQADQQSPFLRLSPFDHGTDSFFAAVLERHIG